MKKMNHVIVGIHIKDRLRNAPDVQGILAQFGCHIRTRIGLHEASENLCSPNGLILLEMVGTKKDVDTFVGKVKRKKGVEVKRMVFGH
jgi:hypothetical protein